MVLLLAEGEHGIAKIDKSFRLVVGYKGDRYKLCDQKAAIAGELDTFYTADQLTIVANVGDKPDSGSVFGVKTEPYIRQVYVPNWGEVFFFRRVKKEERASFIKRLSIIGKRFEKLGIFPAKTFITIVRPDFHPKYAGMYLHKRSEEKQDVIYFFPEDLRKDGLYLAAHELAHGTWFTCMEKEDRSAWIKLYAKNNDPMRFGGNRLGAILAGIQETESIAGYRKQAEPDEKKLLGEALKYVSRVHKIRERELEDLVTSGEDIKGVWPTEPVWLPNHKPWITEYSGESPAELFAEAVSYVVAEKGKVGKTIAKQVEDTFKVVRAKMKGRVKDDNEGNEE